MKRTGIGIIDRVLYFFRQRPAIIVNEAILTAQERMEIKTVNKFLTDDDYRIAAQKLGVPVSVIKAVAMVESNGSGFLDNGDLKMLFEGHVFWKRLKLRGYKPSEYLPKYATVLFRRWKRKHYKGGKREYDRLMKASMIDLDAAYESASWGRFQIMGYHAVALGYTDAVAMVNAFKKSEKEHLMAFVRFLQVNGLDKRLKERNYHAFFRGYNGPGYKRNGYHTKFWKYMERFDNENIA